MDGLGQHLQVFPVWLEVHHQWKWLLNENPYRELEWRAIRYPRELCSPSHLLPRYVLVLFLIVDIANLSWDDHLICHAHRALSFPSPATNASEVSVPWVASLSAALLLVFSTLFKNAERQQSAPFSLMSVLQQFLYSSKDVRNAFLCKFSLTPNSGPSPALFPLLFRWWITSHHWSFVILG